VALLARSIEMWRALPDELGVDLEVALNGGLLVAANEADMAEIERKAAIEREAGLDITLLDRADLRALAPYLAPDLAGGAFCPAEGKANPLLAAPAFAAAARRLGATVLTRAGVTAIEAAGGFWRVVTPRGAFTARRVVNAAGAEAGRIAALVGIDLPVEGFPIQVSVTEPVEPLVPHLLYYTGEKLTLKQTRLGTLLIGGGWPARLDAKGRPVADPHSIGANMAVALRVVPSLASVHLLRTWGAIVNGTDDWKPLLGEVPGRPGFFVNFFPWMGFTAGPLAARAVASLALGTPPPFDIDFAPFRPA